MINYQPLVFVLILNFRSFEDTAGCVESVRTSDYQNFRLLVIDNASPDESGQQLKELLTSNEFLQLSTNTGYAGGNNIGIQIALEAGAKYIFILNPDVRITPNTISICISAAEADPSIGAVNPVQLCGDGCTIDQKFLNTVLRPVGLEAPVYQQEECLAVVEVRELLGAALFISVRAIEQVGGFDPLYFAYGEETDLCRRLRYHGFRLIVTRSAPVLHLRTKESKGVSQHILFLRLKGLYLGLLKDPWRSFRRSLRLVVIQFVEELLGKRRNQYPFKQYPVTRLHSVLAFTWILLNLIRIRRHRRLEQQGRAHV
jgi:GT2 family glycosyltransferase